MIKEGDSLNPRKQERAMPSEATDFLLIDEMLTEEERMVRDTVRAFVDDKVLPIIADCFERGEAPLHLAREMGEMGIIGATLPEEYGCPGSSYVVYGLIQQELERGDSGIRSFNSVQSSLVMFPIYAFGSEEQKRHWLPGLARGEKIGCFGLTEADHGSDPGGMVTRAVKHGDAYVLNGSKMWITNGNIADVAVVWAKLDGEVKGFLVERGTPGFTTNLIKHKMSLRASVTSELVFEDCRIPEENLLPKSGGLRSPLTCLDKARYGIAWGAMGAAMACYEASVSYAKERTQFEKPIGSFQLVQRKLSLMLTEITAAQLMNLRVGRLKDEGKGRHQHTSMAKMNATGKAVEIARMARDLHGANGITLEYPVIRHMNNLESVHTYEGTYDIHLLILGQEITGLSAFR
jgi:glutaryl-CoA dehydrogenase